MATKHGGYYVPEQSVWPIIGALSLLLFAIGSLNFTELWGLIVFAIGTITLLYMLCGWLSSVVRESRSGLYDAQMNRTFRWGMFWFIFCEFFTFGILLGAIIYERVGVIPWLAGQGSGGSVLTNYLLWPDFSASWPLIKNPDPATFAGLKDVPSAWGLPTLNTLVALCSAVTVLFALWAIKNKQTRATITGLVVTFFLGIAFAVMQFDHARILIKQYDMTISSGIYGSLVWMVGGFHFLNLLVGLILLFVVGFRYTLGHFNEKHHFAIEATAWYWAFISAMWLIIYLCIYAF